MNFIGTLNGLFNSADARVLKDKKAITNELKKIIKTEEDIIQFSQFKYLLEIGKENFVYMMFVGHTLDDNLLDRLNEAIENFNNAQISPQIYSYYLYCTLQALKVKTDKVVWINPFINDLENQTEGMQKTFGFGLFSEKVEDFDILNNNLRKFNAKRSYITIPDGVSSVDEKVFTSDQNVEFITLPQSLTMLPHDMVSGCGRLNTVLMTSDVKVIPQNFAKGSKNLSLVIANGVREIKSKAFEGTSISNISFLGSKQLEIIGAEAFAGCEKLRKVDVSNVVEIHPLAFNDCRNITDVAITVTSSIIANSYKFYSFFEVNKNDFKKYELLNKVKVYVPTGEIPDSFFEDCTNVQEIEIVGEIKKIGARAFKNCNNLKTLTIDFEGNAIEEETFYGCRKLLSLPVFKTVEIIENGAFRECGTIDKLTFDLIKELGKNVFQDCSNLIEVKFNYDGELLPEYSFSGCYSLKKYDFLKKVKRIGAYALAKMTFDEKFEIPVSIKGIQTNAFDNCIFEGVLTVPKDCKINAAAFSNINRIDSIIYNNLEISDLNNVKILPYMIFEEKLEVFNENFKQLVNLRINTNKIEEGSFKGWTNIQSVIMDGEFSEIPASCFENCTNLNNVKINSGKFQIRTNAFANCTNLNKLKTNQTKISFNNENVIDLSLATKVESNAFNKCFSIEQVCVTITEQNVAEQFKLHSMFEEIKIDIEGKYEKLQFATLNLETTVVPDYFFDACQNIASVKLIGELEELSEGFFRNCTKLEHLDMQYLGSIIPKECFKNCVSLKNLNVFSYVEVIDAEAFYNCEKLEGVSFECGITKLGKSSFENCNSLKSIEMAFVGDLVPEKCFLNCTSVESFKFLSNITKVESYALSNIKFNEEYAVPHKLEHIDSYAFAGSSFLDTLILPAASVINPLSFSNTSGFTKIEFHNIKIYDSQKLEILPYKLFTDTLRDFNLKYATVNAIIIKTPDICDDAFKEWEFIKNVTISPFVKSLPNSCFEGCVNLERLKLPYYDIALGNRVFTNCENLIDVSFTEFDTKSEISNFVPLGTYHNCTKLESISISIDHTVISSGLKLYSYFEDNLEVFNSKYKKLNSVKIRSKVQEIPESFFEGCINVEKIVILDDVKKLNKNVFAHCSNLQDLKMKFIGEVIPSACFLGCERLPIVTNLKSVKVIEDRAFERCFSITAIQFRTPIESLGAKAFDHCLNLEKINMYYIGEFLPALAFGSCEALLVSPRLLKLVFADNSAFEGCLNLDCVYINAVEGAVFTNIFSSSKRINKIYFSSQTIPARFFSNLRNVEEIIFEKRIISIGDGAFEGVKGLATIKNIDYAETIGDYAFAHSEIEHIRINARTQYIGVGAFAGCENLKMIEMPLRCLYAGVLFDSMNHNSTKKVTQVNGNVVREFLIPEALEVIKITDGVLTPGVFSGMNVDIYVDYDVVKIPDYTFYGCGNVLFSNPDIITKVGAYAFANSYLSDVTLLNVLDVAEYAFSNSVMNSLTIGDKLDKIANTALLGSNINKLTVAETENFLTFNEMLVDVKRGTISHVNNVSGEIIIPEQVHTIETSTFVNCAAITKIRTNKVKTIQTNAFINCSNLTTFHLEENVTTCEQSIIKDCLNVSELFLSFLGKNRKQGKGIDYIFENLPEGSSFKNITITDGVLSNEPFNNCNLIQVLDLSKISIDYLDKGVFKDLTINTLVIPNSISDIKPNAFDQTFITHVVNKNKNIAVSESSIYCLDKLVYCYSTELEKLTLRATVNEIYENAFQICNKITSLDLCNDNVKINKSFEKLTYVDTLSIGETADSISKLFTNCIDAIEVVNYKGQTFKAGYLVGIKSLTNLNLPNIVSLELKSIFQKNSLDKVVIDTINIGSNMNSLDVEFLRYIDNENINIVKNQLFKTKNNMLINAKNGTLIYTAKGIEEEIKIDFKLACIGEKAFFDRYNLISIDTGGVVEVGNDAFNGCNSLKDIIINNECSKIGKDILKNCSKLENITVPFVGESQSKTDKVSYLIENDRTTMINSFTITNQLVIGGTFAYSKNISKIILGEGTAEILADTFNTCIDLKEIEIPTTVTKVEDFAFVNCKKKLVAYVNNKAQADAWAVDWRKVNTNKFFASIKVTYLVGETR